MHSADPPAPSCAEQDDQACICLAVCITALVAGGQARDKAAAVVLVGHMLSDVLTLDGQALPRRHLIWHLGVWLSDGTGQVVLMVGFHDV